MEQNTDPAVLAFFLSMCFSAVFYVIIIAFMNSRKRPPGDEAPRKSDITVSI